MFKNTYIRSGDIVEKVERNFIDPIREVDFVKPFKIENPFKNAQTKMENLFLKKGYILLFIIGFLLGRSLNSGTINAI